ncbi:MAG: hypothetical protein WC436_01895 [Candidatus Babeliales bacterium]
MKIKNFLIYFFLILNISTICFCENGEQEQPDNQNINMQDKQDLDKTLDAFNEFLQKKEEIYPGQDITGSFQNAMLKVVEHQMKMLELLPENCRKKVIETWEIWNELVEKLEKPTNFLLNHCIDIQLKIGAITTDKPSDIQNSFQDFLKKITEFLDSPELTISIQFNSFEEQLQKELESLYQEFDKQFDLLCTEYSNIDLTKDLEILYTCLVSLKNHDIQVFYKYKLDYLKPQIEKAIKNLKDTQQVLEILKNDTLKKTNTQDGKELLEAIEFWQNSLNRFEDFENIEKSSGKENKLNKFISVFLKLAPYIKNGYMFYDHFFQLFKYDNKSKDLYKVDFFKLLKFQFSDAVKINFNSSLSKPAVLTAFLVDKAWSALFVPINLLEKVMGKAQITSYNSMVVKSLMWKFIATCQILIYYNTIHKYFLQNKEELSKFSFPNDYKPFKEMTWSLMKNTGDAGIFFLQNKIKEKVDPEILEKVENYSLGIINPDLFKFSFDTILPIMAYKYFPKNIANLEKHKIFKPEPWDWYYVGRTDFKNMSDAEFIENRILGYLSVNFGGFVGKHVAYGCRKPLKSIFGRVGKFLLVKTGLIQEDFFSNIPEYKKLLLEEVKFLISEKEDEMFIAAKQIFFSLIINFGIVKKADIIALEKAIETNTINDENLTEFADKIISNIADNFVKSVGKGFGSWGGWHLGNYLSNKYGPFLAHKSV